MVLGRDTGGAHDLLMPISEAGDCKAYPGATDRFKDRGALGVREVSGLDLVLIPDPINLFLNVAVGSDGKLVPLGVASKAGSLAMFRVVMDLVIAIAAPAADERLWSKCEAFAHFGSRAQSCRENLTPFANTQLARLQDHPRQSKECSDMPRNAVLKACLGLATSS